MTPRTTIAHLIIERMQAVGWSQNDLADAIHVNKASLSRALRSNNSMLYAKMIDALGGLRHCQIEGQTVAVWGEIRV